MFDAAGMKMVQPQFCVAPTQRVKPVAQTSKSRAETSQSATPKQTAADGPAKSGRKSWQEASSLQ